MDRDNKYIVSLIWSLPLIVAVFVLVTIAVGPKTSHVCYMFKTLLLCFGFATVTSFIYRRFYSIGVGVLGGILTIITLGLIPVIGPIIFFFGGLYLARIELLQLYTTLSKNQIRTIGLVVLVLIAVMLPYFSLEYSQPNNEVRLTKSQLHIDFLYHTAIASMIKNYHAISHGLHGLGALEYHVGSHLLLAESGNLALMPAFQSYNYLFVFLCVPLLGIMIIATAEELLPSKSDMDFYKKLGGYAFIFLGTGVLTGGSLLSDFALWKSFLVSESYEISLILLLSLLSILMARTLSINALVFIVSIIIGLITLTKISTGFFALGLVGAWALFSNEKWWSKNWGIRWGIFFLSAATFLFLFQYINPGMSDAQVNPMQFIHAYVHFNGPSWLTVPLFILLQFIFPISALLYYAINFVIKRSAMIAPAWWALGALFSLAVGLWVLFMLEVQGGSGWYFANVSMFLALPVLLCIPQAGELFFKKLSRICLTVALLMFLYYAPDAITPGAKLFVMDILQTVPKTTLGTYVEKLQTIRDNPDTIHSLIYIPRTETGYWKGMDCQGTGYLIPAISERPALYAWPTNACYSFLCGPRFHSNGLCEKSQESFTDEQLVAEAHKLGFTGVEIVTSGGIRSLR